MVHFLRKERASLRSASAKQKTMRQILSGRAILAPKRVIETRPVTRSFRAAHSRRNAAKRG
eukprot:6014918-Lingulodinium_polyedra.AAC.1